VSSEVLAAPVVAGDAVVVRCSDSRLFGLDVRDGRRRWVYQRPMPTLTVRSTAGVVVRGGTAYAGFAGGRMVAIALNNGGVRWEASVALPRGATELERVADVVGLPWVSEREACAVAYQGRVACFETASGQPLWSREMSSVAGLGVDSRYVFVSDERGAVHALDRSNGTSFWKQDRLFLRQLTAPLPVGREIAVADLEGFVHFLARDNGDFIGRTATDGSSVAAPIVEIPGGFLVQTRRGNLYALSVQDGSKP
jgi:outer membrane protein assembly factor BamB